MLEEIMVYISDKTVCCIVQLCWPQNAGGENDKAVFTDLN